MFPVLQSSVQQHPASAEVYIRQNWHLVPIPPGTKGPRAENWNRKENTLRSHTDLPAGYGIGLAHAYSGTMALDIDDWDTASFHLMMHGVDLNALYDAPDAVVIDSGNPGHGKLLYAMPFGLALPSKKLIAERADGTKYNFLDFRCGTQNGLTAQDVLPPSIHPNTGQPYRWAGRGRYSALPTIPQPLLDLWMGLLQEESNRNIASGGPVDTSWEEIRSAVESINADCSREEWINVGMALHHVGAGLNQTDVAFDVWHEWSAKAESKYPGPRECAKQWKAFRATKANTVTIGTLFHMARQAGWRKPTPDVSSMFNSVQPAEPAQVTLSLRPPPPNLDIDLFPDVLATRAKEVSESVGCDPLVPLFAGLSAVCGAIDARTRLELMPGFKVPPVLWLMTIGEPADKKSPGSRPMFSVLKDLEAEDRPRYAKDQLDFEANEARYKAAKDAFLDFQRSADAMLGALPPVVPEAPVPPTPLKIIVQDITSQKLVRQASTRPRGLLCHLDEMNSWTNKVCDPRSGEDRSSWVVSYESEWYEMDRVGAGTIHCENFAVSIFGNMQPRVFSENFASLTGDGLLQRFIPIILRANQTRLGHPVPDFLTNRATYENMIRTIYGMPAVTYKLSRGAHSAYRAFQIWYEEAKADERLLRPSDAFMTTFGKVEGLVGRLSLLLHAMMNPFDIEVSEDTVLSAIQIVKTYIIPAYRYAYDGDYTGSGALDQWMADHVIYHSDKTELTLSDVKHSAKRQIQGLNVWEQDRAVISALKTLEVAGWVMRIDDGSQEHRHIAQWAINPNLKQAFEDQRKKVIRLKQARVDEMYRDSPQGRKFVKHYEMLEQDPELRRRM